MNFICEIIDDREYKNHRPETIDGHPFMLGLHEDGNLYSYKRSCGNSNCQIELNISRYYFVPNILNITTLKDVLEVAELFRKYTSLI